MAFCKNCGAELMDHTHFCMKCGTSVDPEQQSAPAAAPRSTDHTRRFDPQDIEDNKWLSAFCYFGILLMIFAMIAKPDSKFIRFHANQALVLQLLGIAAVIVSIIPILGWIAGVAASIFSFVCLILGIINCCKGRAKELPLIGVISIIR